MNEPGPDTRPFDFGDFHVDPAQRRVFDREGRPIGLRSRAFDILLYLARRPGELVDKSSLMHAIWPDTVVEEGNLTQSIFALRRALGDTANEPRYIATVPGRGYQCVANVRVSVETTMPAATPARSRSRPWLLAGAAAALLVAVAASLRPWATDATTTRPEDATPAPASIAVLPFADLSSSHDMEYFADGISEELMSSLSRIRGLRIIGRQSSFALKGTRENARSIGEKLEVETILEGTVRKERDRLRVTVQLTRTADGVSLWAETYDRQFDDVLDIQGSIAREVATTLAPAVRGPSAAGRPASFATTDTHDAEAYRAYLRGVYLLSRWYDNDPKPARLELLRAVERDPKFAKAYAMLARTYASTADLGFGSSEQNRALAREALDKAVRLDPTIGELWWVKLIVLDDEKPFAVLATNLEQVVAANPTDTEPMVWLAHIYVVLARRDDALRMFERAYAADPFSPSVIRNASWFEYAFAGDRQRLLDLTDQMERLAPREPQVSWSRANLALNEGRALDWDRFVAKVIEVDPANHQNHAWLTYDYEVLGVYDAALYHANMCAKLEPQSAACTYALARAEMLSGDLAAARNTVQDAMKRDPQNLQVLLALGELQYFTNDCTGALRSIAQARPAYDRPAAAMDLFHYGGDAAIFAWCLRQAGETVRVATMKRVFQAQNGPPATPGMFEAARAVMAAATGDRDALVAELTALSRTHSLDFGFVRHEPMVQPYLADAEVSALFRKFEARRAELRRILPKASTRVPVPGIAGRAGS